MRLFRPRPQTVATGLAVVLSVLVVVLSSTVGFLVVSEFKGRQRDRDAAHAFVQQTVRARYDDCLGGEQVRAALRAQVEEGKRTDPLLYKLVPSLDTPEVHRVVAARRARQLRAYAPRDCYRFALATVPPVSRGNYHVP